MDNIYNILERHEKKLLLLGDLIAVFLAFFLGYSLCNHYYPKADIVKSLFSDYSFYIGAVIFVFLFWLFRLYKYTWRYAGIETIFSIVSSCFVGALAFASISNILTGEMLKLPIAVSFVFLVVFVSLIRMIARYTAKRKYKVMANVSKGAVKNLILVGSENECGLLVKSFRENPELFNYNIVGIVDYDENHKGKFVGNIKILGVCKDINEIAEKNNVNEVLFILGDDFDGNDIKPYVFALRQRKIPVKTINRFTDRVVGNKKLTIKDIDVEDVLHRPSRKIDLNLFSEYITDKVVLVTGGGGSIGSEIVRQVSALRPKQLVLLGHGENSIFKINAEIKELFPELNVYPVIASIADRERIFNTFEKFKPDVVFHAAAHKHVPLMELNIHEAVRNNIFGTKNIADACCEYKVNTMVQISTDKAADPSSVMGATKFMCEQVVKSVAKKPENKTKFVIVRFGNVLGSRGSVIPVFLKQIENGGPVTVTDPQMTRFFMTIPEACRLVVQSGSIGENGHIYVLDMGKPVRIMDLAEDIISICGYVPGKDIEIKISGIRKGEKLHEVLSSETENLRPTDYNGINTVASSEVAPYNYLTDFINGLNTLEKTKNAETFISEVNKIKKFSEK